MKLKTLIAITVAIAIIATFVPMPDFVRLIFGVGVLAFGVASIITAIRIRKQ